MTTTGRTVAIYLRISDDKNNDEQGVKRQEADALALAEARGWATRVYRDNDMSAFKRNVVRPAFERMVRDLREGTVTGIMAYDLDRLWRQPMDLERVIEIYERHKTYPFVTLQVDIDLSTSDGQMLARVMVAAANKSSADTARRVARKHADNQLKGLPGGGPRPFGFMADRITHEPREAAAILHVMDSILQGGSTADQVRYLNGAGLTTTKGNRWNPASLRATLRNPRIKGVRARWDGKAWESVLDATGTPVKAIWAPVVPVDKFDALQAILAQRGAAFKGGIRGAHKYLLSGIARCGVCGSGLRGNPSRHDGRHNYTCPPATQGGCGGVARDGSRVDAIVTEAVKDALAAHLRGAHKAPKEWAGEDTLKRLDGLLADALQAWKGGALPSGDYFALRAELEAERKALIAERAEHALSVGEHSRLIDADMEWGGSIARQRAIIGDLVDAVVIEPLPVVEGRKVRAWNPDLIVIHWRD